MKASILLCILLLPSVGSSIANAQESENAADEPETQRVHPKKDSPIAFGVQVELKSKVLDEMRTLNIYLPPSYEQENEKAYPVIYLLDGGIDEDYHHQTGLVQFLVMYQLMPESIVVGIANTDRKRDMTHPTSDEEERTAIPTCGGSARFLEFIKTELQPFMAQRYRTSAQKTIIGQSLGALLATEALIRNPELFDNYVIVSPSLYWSNRELILGLKDFLKNNPDLNKKVFLAMGKEHPLMHETMDLFVAALQKHAPEGMSWKYAILPDETHATVMHRATYQAYEFLYGNEYEGL
jgi:predicted alpha/beta superfamily hydrolase